MKEFKLILTINETNLILKALGNMPFNQVNELVAKIHAQAQEQLLKTSVDELTSIVSKNESH